MIEPRTYRATNLVHRAKPVGGNRAAERASARMRSDRLAKMLNREFDIAAERWGVSFEDARLLLCNGVGL